MTRKLLHLSGNVLLIFSLTLLCGCKANLEWFIRNFSTEEITLILRYETKKEKYRPDVLPLKTDYVYYIQKILPINDKTFDLLEDSLHVTALDSSSYQLTIPAKSTVDLTDIVPTDYYYLFNVVAEFRQKGSLYSINTRDVFEKRNVFRTGGGFSLKNLIYYDYGARDKHHK